MMVRRLVRPLTAMPLTCCLLDLTFSSAHAVTTAGHAAPDRPPAAVAYTAPWPDPCLRDLSCTKYRLAAMSSSERLSVVSYLQRRPAQRFERGFARWNALQAFVEVLAADGLGQPGTWSAYVDGAALEALVRGLALALGLSGDDYGNPGARRWARYLTRLAAGRLDVKAVHNREWAGAEQASIDHGRRPGYNPATPSRTERALLAASELYRLALRNESTIMFALGALHQPRLTHCYDWLTDTRNPLPVRDGARTLVAVTRVPPDLAATAAALTRLARDYPSCTHGFTPAHGGFTSAHGRFSPAHGGGGLGAPPAFKAGAAAGARGRPV
ncbi:hypothetical protein [Actinomadura fibrosa]|uniref:Uncharacterized protein n=1 Tax=Actinomadura fibrosa TaxID=111802 RepID=A0ABW2XKN8_9ACTN|nr:hypothetical protein [Actinomadura fibrosa]